MVTKIIVDLKNTYVEIRLYFVCPLNVPYCRNTKECYLILVYLFILLSTPLLELNLAILYFSNFFFVKNFNLSRSKEKQTSSAKNI